MSQLSFPFFAEKAYQYNAEDLLLLPENKAAFSALDKILTQQDYTKSPLHSLIIRGETGCGKTHLLHFFSKKYGGEFLSDGKLHNTNLLELFLPNHFYFLEDIEKIKNEELLLNLINSASEAKAFLILTTHSTPNLRLKDLVSRFKNIPAISIENPSQGSVKQLLLNQLARRQIKIPTATFNFLYRNLERSYSAILHLTQLLAGHQKNEGNLTIAEAKELLHLAFRRPQ